jgi:ABC-type Fe3+ transport system substrate-binding protein
MSIASRKEGMTARRRLALGLMFCALAAPCPAAAAEPYRPDLALVAAAKKEGQVLIYTTLIVDQIVRPLIRAFQAQVPGIDVKFVRADSVGLVVRMTNEAKANRTQADIWQLVDGVGPLVDAGIAAKFDLPSAKGLPADYIDPRRRWITTNLAVRSLAYNTKLVPPATAPRGYADLLDPRFKGKFAWSPHSVSGAYGFIGTVLKHMGEEKGVAYLRALARQDITPVPMAIRAVLDRVIAGEYSIGLEMNGTHAHISAGLGAPVRWVPLDPVTLTLQAAGMTAKAPHPNAARLFLDFMISRAGQEVFRARDYIPMHPDVPAKNPELKPETGGYKAVVYSPEEVDANHKRWAQIFQEIFR